VETEVGPVRLALGTDGWTDHCGTDGLQASGESSPAFPGLVRVRVFWSFVKRLDSSPDLSPTSRVRNWERKDSLVKSSRSTRKTTYWDLILDLLTAKILFSLKNKSLKDSSPWLKTRIISFSLENCQKTRILGLDSEDSTHHYYSLQCTVQAAIARVRAQRKKKERKRRRRRRRTRTGARLGRRRTSATAARGGRGETGRTVTTATPTPTPTPKG
jgi:hypothetical protein